MAQLLSTSNLSPSFRRTTLLDSILRTPGYVCYRSMTKSKRCVPESRSERLRFVPSPLQEIVPLCPVSLPFTNSTSRCVIANLLKDRNLVADGGFEPPTFGLREWKHIAKCCRINRPKGKIELQEEVLSV